MKNQKPFPFFSHQSGKTIPLSADIKTSFGEYPDVKVLMYNEAGELSVEPVPVKFILNEFDETASINIITSNKNGLIILS